MTIEPPTEPPTERPAEPARGVPLEPGLEHTMTFEVTASMVPGHVPAPVLSTPSLVALVETTCRRAVLPLLPEGRDTVGVHIAVSHEGVARQGEEVVVVARLAAVDRRRLTFEVAVDGPRGAVSRGTHQRVVIDSSRFGS
jgi:fluoroacetyl-CoA thioesterase